MAEFRIAGIMRAGAFSPNHIGNDAAIFNLVAEQLRKRGCQVTVYSEEQFAAGLSSQPDVVINMCRQLSSIQALQALEDKGTLVLNSGYGIENCMRERMTRILLGSGIPCPDSLIVSTDERILPNLKKARIDRCWIKRGDGHTQHREDVAFARHAEEAQELLQEFFLRGIKKAVINRHLEGDLVKFYGLADSSFFFWFYPLEAQHSKYGAEAINGQSHHYKFDLDRLKAICMAAAEALGIHIYGGDCIIASDGTIRIIDFNDWPSFAPCRNEAAPHIAKLIMKELKG